MAKIVILLMQIEIMPIQMEGGMFSLSVAERSEALELSESLRPRITSLVGQMFKSQRRWNIKEAKL